MDDAKVVLNVKPVEPLQLGDQLTNRVTQMPKQLPNLRET